MLSIRRFFSTFTPSPITMEAAKQKAQTLIDENAVMVFSKSYCPYCRASKKTLQNAGAIVFVINLKNSTTKMGVLQAFYGLGALISPLVATEFATKPHWSYHYLTALGGAIINVMVLCLVFRFEHMDGTSDRQYFCIIIHNPLF